MTTTPVLKAAALAATPLDIEQERREFESLKSVRGYVRRDHSDGLKYDYVDMITQAQWEGWLTAKATMFERLQVTEDAAKLNMADAERYRMIRKRNLSGSAWSARIGIPCHDNGFLWRYVLNEAEHDAAADYSISRQIVGG